MGTLISSIANVIPRQVASFSTRCFIVGIGSSFIIEGVAPQLYNTIQKPFKLIYDTLGMSESEEWEDPNETDDEFWG